MKNLAEALMITAPHNCFDAANNISECHQSERIDQLIGLTPQVLLRERTYQRLGTSYDKIITLRARFHIVSQSFFFHYHYLSHSRQCRGSTTETGSVTFIEGIQTVKAKRRKRM